MNEYVGTQGLILNEPPPPVDAIPVIHGVQRIEVGVVVNETTLVAMSGVE